MARSNADLLAIKAELTNDPKALGLVAPPAIDDVGNANILNTVNVALQVDRTAIPMSEISQNVVRSEYAALAAPDRDWLNYIGADGIINPKTGGAIRTGLLQLFSSGSQTRTNLLTLLTESASRINQMYSEGLLEQGGSVTPSDVANARNAV